MYLFMINCLICVSLLETWRKIFLKMYYGNAHRIQFNFVKLTKVRFYDDEDELTDLYSAATCKKTTQGCITKKEIERIVFSWFLNVTNSSLINLISASKLIHAACCKCSLPILMCVSVPLAWQWSMQWSKFILTTIARCSAFQFWWLRCTNEICKLELKLGTK